MTTQNKPAGYLLASLASSLVGASEEFRILPEGLFRANDGRPERLPGWKLDATIASDLIAIATRSGMEMVIDYEHQTLNAAQNGNPAPAAGWFKEMTWRPGKGLFAKDVRWTKKAKEMILAGEYRYVSPVFQFNEETGAVAKIIGLGITNNPALDNLTDLSNLAINSRQLSGSIAPEQSRSIEAFNAAFGQYGIFHPQTKRQ